MPDAGYPQGFLDVDSPRDFGRPVHENGPPVLARRRAPVRKEVPAMRNSAWW
jgi:hypothetical protein